MLSDWRLLRLLAAVVLTATAVRTAVVNNLDFDIKYNSDGSSISHDPANIRLEASEDGTTFYVTIRSLFFHDPEPPVPTGSTFNVFSRFEYAELQFINEDDHYFSLIVNPYGVYLARSFSPALSAISDFLAVNISAEISPARDSWVADIDFPVDYLPQNVTLFNAQYSYGKELDRKLSFLTQNNSGSVFITKESSTDIDLDQLVPGLSEQPLSSTWTDILQKPLRYEIKRFLNGTLLNRPSSVFEFDSTDEDILTVRITSQFYNEPPPNVPDGTRTSIVAMYEVAQLVFIDHNDYQFTLYLGPRGHYYAAMFDDTESLLRGNIILNVTAQINPDRKTWTGVVQIPAEYLPSGTSFFNIFYYSNGIGDFRDIEAYHPAFPILPGMHDGSLVQHSPLNLDLVIPGFSNNPQSKVWSDVLNKPYNYEILTTYDNKPLQKESCKIQLDERDTLDLNIYLNCSFAGDESPSAPNGTSLKGLWRYERAEVFFANDKDEYFQLSVGPFGHHYGILFSGIRNFISTNVALDVETTLDETRGIWQASIVVPKEYLPYQVSKWNAYYAYGSVDNQKTEAFSPSMRTVGQVDFHDLSIFAPIDIDNILTDFSLRETSSLWDRASISFDITTKYSGEAVAQVPARFTIEKADDDNILITLNSTFMNDPKPPVPENSSYIGIWQYEVAEIFFANDKDEYFQLEFGPYGQFQVMLLSGERHYERFNLPVVTSAAIKDQRWTGTVRVPIDYLPEKVSKFNAYYSYGPRGNREYQAFNAEYNDVQPDFHNLKNFARINLDYVVPGLSDRQKSQIWSDALEGKISYEINSNWDGTPIKTEPVKIVLEGNADELHLLIDAPFFNDPAPKAKPGEPFKYIWQYEVVHALFLNDLDQYMEVAVGPHGQYSNFLMWSKNGSFNQMRNSLPLNVTTKISGDRWTGRVVIPRDYFPPVVNRFNAHNNHGIYPNRNEKSLYPQDPRDLQPDFQKLQYFQPIDFNTIVPNQSEKPMSQLWMDTVLGIYRYGITTQWNSVPVDHLPVIITLEGFEGGVEMNVTAPFFNDPAPIGDAGKPLFGLWDYEVVEMFFLNDNDEYLEVEVGPWGQHLLLMLKGERNAIKHSLPLDYVVTERINGTKGELGQWQGSALIPPEYFPPNVTRMNAYAIHGTGDNRVYESLYPAPLDDPNYPAPDFHQLGLFQKIDFEFLVVDNSDYSPLWVETIQNISKLEDPKLSVDHQSSVGSENSVVSDFAVGQEDRVHLQIPVFSTHSAIPVPSVVPEPAVLPKLSVVPESVVEPKVSVVPQPSVVTELKSPGDSRSEVVDDRKSEPFVVVFKKPVGAKVTIKNEIDSNTERKEIHFETDSIVATETEEPVTTFERFDDVTETTIIDNEIVETTGTEDPIEETTILAQEGSIIPSEFIRGGSKNPKPSKVPQPELVKEARFQNIDQPNENFLRPLLIRPPSFDNRPVPSKINNKNVDKFSHQNLGSFNKPQFFSEPHFPTPTIFAPQQPHLFPDNSPYNNGFQVPVLLNQGGLLKPLPKQPHLDHLEHHNRQQEQNLLDQQVVDELPIPINLNAVQSPKRDQLQKPIPLPLPIFDNPADVETGTVETTRPATEVKPTTVQKIQVNPPSPVTEQQDPSQTGRITQVPPSAIPTNFPPPQNAPCYYEGLFPDPNRCPLFFECAFENNEMKVYSWRCPRGKYFDPQSKNCVSGYC